jgi:tRNA (guanine-N7-)-methyltransferase
MVADHPLFTEHVYGIPVYELPMNKPLEVIDLFRSTATWRELIGPGEQPVELEIGSGKGLFLQHAATRAPDHIFIGIELSAKFAQRAAQRLARHGLTNVRVLRGDAQRFLGETVPDESISRLHVYFPDPWWRQRHKKRRVLNEQTLADIERTLAGGGEFHFWTDVADYYEFICSQVMELTRLQGPRYVPEKEAQHEMDYTTHFERRARLNSQPVYRAIFDKHL